MVRGPTKQGRSPKKQRYALTPINTAMMMELIAIASGVSRAGTGRMLGGHHTSTVTDHIEFLEAWFGGKISEGKGEGAELTMFGREVAEAVKNAMTTLSEARHPDWQKYQADTVRIAALQSIIGDIFPRWYDSIIKAIPAVKIELRTGSVGQCQSMLLAGEVDFFLCHDNRLAPLEAIEDLKTEVIVAQDELIPVCHKDHWREIYRHIFETEAAKDADDVPPDHKIPLFHYAPRTYLHRIVEDIRVAHPDKVGRAKLETRFTTPNAAGLKAMVRRHRGVTWLPRSSIQRDKDMVSELRHKDLPRHHVDPTKPQKDLYVEMLLCQDLPVRLFKGFDAWDDSNNKDMRNQFWHVVSGLKPIKLPELLPAR